MTIPRFLQIHTLHSYPAALLNRDDSGLAKRMPFGGAVRTRISSQCLKRHWRVAQDEFALRNIAGATSALRSRNIVERKVMEPIRAAGGASDEVFQAVEDAFNIGVYGRSGTTESGRQPLLLGLPEVEHLRERAAAICAEHLWRRQSRRRGRCRAFQRAAGRGQQLPRPARYAPTCPRGWRARSSAAWLPLTPAPTLTRAIHVAHAFTVHGEESESDYFSVVDDLQRDDEDAGAAHIGDMELTAGLFYGYVVVDVPVVWSPTWRAALPARGQTPQTGTLAANVVEHLTASDCNRVPPGPSWGLPRPTSLRRPDAG